MSTIVFRIIFTYVAIGIVSVASCAEDTIAERRQQMIAVLDHEMRTNTGFVRIHAADALIDQGQTEQVSKFFEAEIATTQPQYRIGVWRVMARAAATEEARRGFVERMRRAMLDPDAPDRLHAAESLGKVGIINPEDRPAIAKWLATLDDATAAFPRWLLVLSSSPADRAADEASLARLLDSKDSAARLRAAFALGRLKEPAESSVRQLREQLAKEPADSPARVYLIAALFAHTPRQSLNFEPLKTALLQYLEKGKPNEQMTAATAIGMIGGPDDLPALNRLLSSPQADARIGAALGLLYLFR